MFRSVTPYTLVLMLLASGPVAAAVEPGANLVVNPSFEKGMDGWELLTPGTAASIDPEARHDGRFSIRVDGNGARAGIGQKEIRFEAPLPTQLSCRYAGKRTNGSPDSAIGLDLVIALDDGTKVWHLPPDLSLTGADEKWAEKSGRYRAPDGRRIVSCRVLCVNLNGQDTAWFDTVAVSVTPRIPESDIVILDTPSEEMTRATAILSRARVRFEPMPWEELGPACKLAIVAAWKETQEYSFALRRYHFLGGRLILLGLPDTPFSRALSLYLFDKPPSALGEKPVVSEEGRAVWIPDARGAAPEAITRAIGDLMKVAFPPTEPPSQVRQSRYQIRAGRLLEEGRPLLWRAMGARYTPTDQADWLEQWKADASLWRTLGLNGGVLYFWPYSTPEAIRQALDVAQANGLRIVIWISPPYSGVPALPFSERWIRRVATCGNHPAFMAWELADDTYHPFYPILERMAGIIRAQAPGLLLTTTVMETRHPEKVSAADWQRWRALLDYPLPYVYPLQRGEHFAAPNIRGGLEDVELLSENTRAAFGPDAYIQQWCQAHLQPFAYPPSGLSPKEYFAPTPEQMRLLTYMTLASGSRGIAYFSPAGFTDEALGVGRRAETGILWQEMAPVEGLIAGGDRAEAAVAGDPSVRAAAYHGNAATLLLVVKHGKNYHRYVDGAAAEGVRVSVALPWRPTAGVRAYALSYPRVRELKCDLAGQTAEVRLERFHLTEMVLLAPGASLADAATARMRETLPQAARWALEELCDSRVKTEVVMEYLGSSVAGEARQYATLGGGCRARASEALAKGDPQAAYTAAREGLAWYRRVQSTLVEQAEALIARKGLPEDAYQNTNIFASLPRFYELHAGGKKVEPWAMGNLVRTRLEAELKAIPQAAEGNR